MEPAGAVRVIIKKKNWRAPGPDRSANFWWKNVGLQWKPERCAATHRRRGVHVSNRAEVNVDGNAKLPSLEEGQECKFLGVPEYLKQEKLALKFATKEYLRRMSLI